jgi:hypothetical protein
MKMSKINIETIKRILITMIVMTVVIFLYELYVPIKRLIMGDDISLNEILSYIKYKQYFPYIFLAGMVIGLLWYKSDRQNEDK